MLRSDHSAFSRFGSVHLIALGALLGALAVGCTPKIGDKCTISTDCSATGGRLCDITEPGGYCTVFNCEPDGCPDNAGCINFGAELSLVNGCTASQGNSPYQRSFCLAACSSDSDCREGYSCLAPGDVGGVSADSTSRGKVCAVKRTAEAEADGAADSGPRDPASPEVCMGSDASAAAETSAGGASGSAEAGSASSGASGGASGADNAGAGG